MGISMLRDQQRVLGTGSVEFEIRQSFENGESVLSGTATCKLAWGMRADGVL